VLKSWPSRVHVVIQHTLRYAPPLIVSLWLVGDTGCDVEPTVDYMLSHQEIHPDTFKSARLYLVFAPIHCALAHRMEDTGCSPVYLTSRLIGALFNIGGLWHLSGACGQGNDQQ
jgi:hypothetical protein